jgi:pimeloyl-ACP methyl ester carboxylesterase
VLLSARLEVIDGRRVRVARLGSGPPLVLLHGYPDDLQAFCRLARLLASAHEVIAFDWPGMGWSDEAPGGASPADLADRLLFFLYSWHVEKATLAGIDMGAPPALVLAARHPERVGRLVVMNSLLFGDEETSIEIRVMRRLGLNALALRFASRAVFARVLATSLPRGERLEPELVADLWGAFRRGEVRSFVARLCAHYEAALPALPELYARVACPTLLLWAESDRHFPLAHARRLHSLLPASRLEVIAGAGHWMHLSHAERVADTILAFTA